MTDTPLHIDWATHEAAKYACINWHYSKCLPVGKLVKVGVWEHSKFIGVVLFARGANKNLLSPFGLGQDEGCELARVALNKHKAAVSQIVSIAIKKLKQSQPKLRLIVSYADIDEEHVGTIYQAGNWIYTGATNVGARQGFIIRGRKTHNKSIHSAGCRQTLKDVRAKLDPYADEFYTKGKHRYLMPLDKTMREQIAHLAKQYPKRAASIDSDACSSQLQEGGATPTAALNL